MCERKRQTAHTVRKIIGWHGEAESTEYPFCQVRDLFPLHLVILNEMNRNSARVNNTTLVARISKV